MKQPSISESHPQLDQYSATIWERRFLVLITGLFLWRLLFIYIVPLDLVPDEAYYWDWSRHLALGYYSKPPMIAWINALSTGLLGAGPFAVRLPAVVFGTLGLVLLYLLAKRLFDARIGFWTVATVAASPGNTALNLLMTIDAPLVFFWCLALYCLWQALEDGTTAWRWWLATAMAVGLGSLSKQMMLVFLLLMLLFLAVSGRDRPLLKRPWPYLVIGISLLMLVPVLWWNQQHDWITLQHTSHHFAGNHQFFRFFQTVPDFIGSQLLLISPVTWLLLAALTASLLPRLLRQRRPVQFLLLFSSIVLIVILMMSFRQRINGNWPAVYYPAGLLLLSAWGCGAVSLGNCLDRWRRFYFPGVAIGAGFTVLTYMLPFIMTVTGLSGGKFDPTVRLKGWHELGRQVGDLLAAQPHPEQTFLLAMKRQEVSELAFYVPGQPQVYRWAGGDKEVKTQYELWPGPQDKRGWSGLILLEGPEAKQALPDDLTKAFASVRSVGELHIPLGPGGQKTYTVFQGQSLQKWP